MAPPTTSCRRRRAGSRSPTFASESASSKRSRPVSTSKNPRRSRAPHAKRSGGPGLAVPGRLIFDPAGHSVHWRVILYRLRHARIPPEPALPRFSCLLASSSLLASPAFAQATAPADTEAPAPPAQHVDEHTHHHGGEEIVVTGHLVRELDLLAGKSVLTGADLQRELRPQLGDTL